MKPDQERVKNLLLDTVTLLCKNSLQYENKLRVEGLLGVCVDDNDVFFLHISENFQNNSLVDLSSNEITNDTIRDSSHDREENNTHVNERQEADRRVKPEPHVHDIGSDSEDLIITSSAPLNCPQTVAHPATVVAGQRRTPHKRTHSPAFRDISGQQLHNSSNLSQDSLNSSHHHMGDGNGTTVGNTGDYGSFTECGNGASFDQIQGQHIIKQESGWDQEPASKRHLTTTDSSPWPNLAGLGDLAAQAAQAAQEAEEGGGGSYSQPGCSTWPSSAQILANTAVHESMFSWGRVVSTSDLTSSTAATTLPAVAHAALLGGGSFALHRHVCQDCHSVFTNAIALEKHCSLRHRGEKPWVCSVCAAAFARKDYLESHFRIHTGEKPYRCQLCTAAFRQKGKLNKHMANIHRTEEREERISVKISESGIMSEVQLCGDVGEAEAIHVPLSNNSPVKISLDNTVNISDDMEERDEIDGHEIETRDGQEG